MMNPLSHMKHATFEMALRAWAVAKERGFERRDPFTVQRRLLDRLIARGSATRFGRDHALAPLSGKPFDILYREFRQRVPIRTYADFWRDYFSAGYREEGEKRSLSLTDVTWPGKVPFFCETSGMMRPIASIR